MLQSSTLRVESTPPTVNDALAQARAGMAIIPLHTRSKIPRVQNWQERGTTDEAIIRQWWRMWPESNIGYVIPRGVLVMDVDPRNGGLVGFKNLLARHGDLPTTWRVWSGRHDGGFHAYFTGPAGMVIPEATDLDLGVQVLGPRHLVVLAPSSHPTTDELYSWDETHNPFSMPTPAPAPQWLVAVILETGKRHAQRNQSRDPRAVRRVRSGDAQPHEAGDTDNRTPGAHPTPDSNKVPQDRTPPLGTLCEGPGKHLVALACDPKNLPALLEACGILKTLQVGDSTKCPCHDDETPSASLLGPTAEHPSYGIYCHAAACKKYYSLTDIFYHRQSANLLYLHTKTDDRTGQVRHHAALRLQWLTRLLEAAGVLRLHELGSPSLPPNAPDDAKAVWDAYLHVRRIRAATRKTSDPFPFSLRFIEDWVGRLRDWTAYRINQAKRWLIAHGFLEVADKDATGYFWRIGRHGLRQRRRDASVLPTENANVAAVAATPVPAPDQRQQTTACPAMREPDHDPRQCLSCIQARLVAKRVSGGIWHDPDDPYGRQRSASAGVTAWTT